MISLSKSLFVLIFTIVITQTTFGQKISSPDKAINLQFELTSKGKPTYSVYHNGLLVIQKSDLGLVREDADFSKNLTLLSVSKIKRIKGNYQLLHGKSKKCSYKANKRVFHLATNNNKPIDIIFQISNDGVAFRYNFPDTNHQKHKITVELSSFHFASTTKGFLQPCAEVKSGWSQTQPSYEEYYNTNIDVGSPSPHVSGWVLPALFNYKNYWIHITEGQLDSNYCGSRLSQLSPNGNYTIQFPDPREGKSGGSVYPESTLPWLTPWRIITITDNKADLIHSNLGTDLAKKQQYDVSDWLQPGISSWSWIIEKDDTTTYDSQIRYIDYAAKMNWKYCLIDAWWDKQIGYKKTEKLVKYAAAKNVKILVWYNSAGDWNTVNLTPHNKINQTKVRKQEFERLQKMGVAGIKVDFFGGDGQSMIGYYIDILQDAAQYQLAVNFHGCIVPKGWHRTYPNLVSMEGVRGEEYVTFDQKDADLQANHCTVLPFTRNLYDPMDYTPVNFSGIPYKERKTTNGFEIALSVLFTSGVQHIAETPEGMEKQPQFVIDYMRSIPSSWDEVQFIDGTPAEYVVLARRKGKQWYIGGINGLDYPVTLTLDLSEFKGKKQSVLISDVTKNQLQQQNIDLSQPITIKMKSQGGFVITN